MSQVLNNIMQNAANDGLTAPFLERPTPSSVQYRPTPTPTVAAPNFPTPFRRQRAAGELDPGTASSMVVQSEESDPEIVPTVGIDSISISTVQQASPEELSNIKDGIFDKFVSGVFGMGQSYNPITGTIDTAPPNFGLIGAPTLFTGAIKASSMYMKNRQEAAAKNAAQGMKDNGLVQINGTIVAVVDGRLHGNLPKGSNYDEVRRAALDYINKGDPNDFAGTFARPPITASDPRTEPTTYGSLSSGDEDSGDNTGGGTSFSGGTSMDASGIGGDSTYGALAKGGRVGMQAGGTATPPAGFVQGPPSEFSDKETVADDQEMQVPEGTFVINAPAVEFAGSNDIRRMILDAYAVAREKGLDIGQVDRTIYEESVDVALSKGEVVIPPALVKIIGLDRLQKINNRGKREVSRRQKQAAQGGFIEGYAEGDMVEADDYETPSPEFVKKLSEFGMKKRQRGEIKDFIRSLSPQEAYTVLFLTETSSNSESMENMENIGYVVRNRINSDYADFKNVNNVYDALLQQTKGGAFQFSGLEPSIMYKRLSEVNKGLADLGLRKATSASSNVTDTEPDREAYSPIPFNALFYTKPNAKNQWMRSAKNLEYLMESGGHEFYGPFASPEGFQ